MEVRFHDAFDKWTKPKERTSKALADFMVMEQLIEDMPQEAQLQVCERKPKTAREAGELADDYYLARKAATGGDKRRCYKCDRTGHLAVECKDVREGFDRGVVEGNRNLQNAKQGNNFSTASRNQTWNTRQEGSTRTPREVKHGNKTNRGAINVTVWVTLQLTVQIVPTGLEMHP